MMIFQWLKQKSRRRAIAQAVYQDVLEQSRQAGFYADCTVPDNTDGHFDLLCLHVFLVMNRLNDFGAEGRAQAQALFDAMFRRMELDLREMGVGDLGVPKHMKRMMKGFNGRAHAYRDALTQDSQTALELAVARNIYHVETTDSAGVRILANYIRAVHVKLAQCSFDDIVNVNISYPPVSEGVSYAKAV